MRTLLHVMPLCGLSTRIPTQSTARTESAASISHRTRPKTPRDSSYPATTVRPKRVAHANKGVVNIAVLLEPFTLPWSNCWARKTTALSKTSAGSNVLAAKM
ncbi:hypothetical protein A1O7_07140 [Cladophialophora yegresii CBS 114405]|uniref:Uncharacterized protein n=1 Tax=Cladophialophora yegresii CBS 114405 TaxID=1182544 RepID=W9VX38_9EURO|nr:uncharacterized protein A1O7_07140 [Cladophialophora yegresii CBS 114405]EXJ56796.1 hypothetical protein A1O7_07140 [Cladophialophora yegresii CBS 114405]